MKNESIIAIVVIVAVLICLVAVPFAEIWAVNTLFGTSIPYNAMNWLAVVVLNFCLRAPTPKIEKK